MLRIIASGLDQGELHNMRRIDFLSSIEEKKKVAHYRLKKTEEAIFKRWQGLWSELRSASRKGRMARWEALGRVVFVVTPLVSVILSL